MEGGERERERERERDERERERERERRRGGGGSETALWSLQSRSFTCPGLQLDYSCKACEGVRREETGVKYCAQNTPPALLTYLPLTSPFNPRRLQTLRRKEGRPLSPSPFPHTHPPPLSETKKQQQQNDEAITGGSGYDLFSSKLRCTDYIYPRADQAIAELRSCVKVEVTVLGSRP